MTEQNKQVARRFNEAFNAGDVEAMAGIVAADFVDHPSGPGQDSGREELFEAMRMYHAAFPDLRSTVENLVAEGDRVALHGVASGTNTGELMGMPATGKKATFSYIDIYRIADGRIAEIWHVEDVVGMLRQLGAMPG
ncbi:ester cyclase [Arthrobacter sp. GCM10027362]|uniref:ester cyclase n=1 Tax=Arthrobacter sp. GCM10027362 TaxID=3273379 RepID=UPI00364309C5